MLKSFRLPILQAVAHLRENTYNDFDVKGNTYELRIYIKLKFGYVNISILRVEKSYLRLNAHETPYCLTTIRRVLLGTSTPGVSLQCLLRFPTPADCGRRRCSC